MSGIGKPAETAQQHDDRLHCESIYDQMVFKRSKLDDVLNPDTPLNQVALDHLASEYFVSKLPLSPTNQANQFSRDC